MKSLLPLLVYLVLFGPNFIYFDSFLITNIFMALAFLIYSIYRFKLKMSVAFIIGLSLLAIGTYIPTMIAYNFSEHVLLIEYFKLIIYTCSAFLLVEIYKNYYQSEFQVKLLIHTYYCITIVSLTVLSFFLFPVLRGYFYPILGVKMATMWEVQQGIRFIDLSVGAGTTLSLIFFIGTVLNITLIEKKYLSSYFSTVVPVIFLFTAFLTGRTGMVLIIFYFLFKFFTTYKFKLNRIAGYKAINISLFCILILYFLYTPDSVLSTTIPWALEIFINFIESGSVSTASSSNLFNDHYFFNFTNQELIFGKNFYNVKSDVGYLKILYGNGLIGLFFFILFYVSIIFNVAKSSSQEYDFIKYLWLLLMATILIVNFKELLFTNSRGLFMIILIWYFTMLEINKKGGSKFESISLHSHM